MKITLLLVVLTALAAPAHAESVYSGPLLSQLTEPGFVKPEEAVSTECDVYADKIVVTQKYFGAGVVTTSEKPVSLANQNLTKLIDGASKGQVKQAAAPADIPSVFQKAFLVDDAGQAKAVVLSEVNGDNGTRLTNASPEAQALTWLIGQLCR